MILTTDLLVQQYDDYGNPNDVITRLLKKKKIFRLIRGVYCDDSTVNSLFLANSIYNPSYVSFETALAYYNLIPETVYNVTCATCTLTKVKTYKNKWGAFIYRNVPQKVYPLDINVVKQNEYVLFIASPEKALCDQLYKCPVCKNQKHLEYLLFEDLRIDAEEFNKLNKEKLIELCPTYHSTNLTLFAKYLIRRKNELHN